MDLAGLFGRYLRLGKVDGIVRRYFVMNAFDGALTMLGILVGAYVSGSDNLALVLHAGFGAAVAMGVSGVSGAYLTEKAERRRDLRELEGAMLADLYDTEYGRISRSAVLFTALVDGFSPAAAAFVILAPFLFVGVVVGSYVEAFWVSAAVALSLLFCLGVYLGGVSGESKAVYGVRTLAVGVLTALLVFMLEAAGL